MYVGINKNKGINVMEEDAYDYAKTHLDDMDKQDKQLFVDFFFSGDFVRRKEND